MGRVRRPRNAGGCQYRWPRALRVVVGDEQPRRHAKLPLDNDAFEGLPEVTRDGATFLVWNKSDFGPIAWNLVPSDMYVHTTPDEEAEANAAPDSETSLSASHGCIHIEPRERDEMMKRGYLGTNILFVVRRWDEHLLPDQVRREMLRRGKP
jgi:hypothetical protein